MSYSSKRKSSKGIDCEVIFDEYLNSLVGNKENIEYTYKDQYYGALEVTPSVTPNALKKAYQKALLKHHPDKGGNPIRFTKVQKAYKLLKNPESKAVYNEFGEKAAEFFSEFTQNY